MGEGIGAGNQSRTKPGTQDGKGAQIGRIYLDIYHNDDQYEADHRRQIEYDICSEKSQIVDVTFESTHVQDGPCFVLAFFAGSCQIDCGGAGKR